MGAGGVSLSTCSIFENKDTTIFILTLFGTMFLKFELLRKFWKHGRYMLNSNAIWNDVLEVGTAEKKLKAWAIYVEF